MVIIFSKVCATEHLPGIIETPYSACKDELIVSKEKYQENEQKWKEWESKCHRNIQVAEEAGITRLGSLNEGVQYLNFTTKIAKNVMSNLDKSLKYAQCSQACFKGATNCNAELTDNNKSVSCADRRAEILHGLKIVSQKLRKELALANVAPNFVQKNIINFLFQEDDKHFNKNLLDIDLTTPNPVGHSEMQADELQEARNFVKNERAKVEEDYKKMLTQDKVNDTPKLHQSWVGKKWMDQIDKRKVEHQERYRQLVYEESPLLSVIEKATKFENGANPVWTDKQLADAFFKLSTYAESTKKSVQESIDSKKLEFRRDNGDALIAWIKQLKPGLNDHNDLLHFMGMTNQVEEVLKNDKSLCAVATTLSGRLQSKDIQNNAVVFAASFVAGAPTKILSRGGAALFKIGRALTGSEAASLSGLAIGGTYLADSFRQYNSTVSEATNGLKNAKDIDSAKTNVGLNLVFAPALASGGWGLGKTLYSSLGKKMAKDLPEVASLLEKGVTNQSARDLAVDKWMMAKVKKAIKNNILEKGDEVALQSKVGGEILDDLSTDILKNNPKFFNDPNNLDYFLKAAATLVKKRPGDPADLADKAKKLFLSLNVDAFQTWDPKARTGLMKVYSEGVEELRSAYIKDPAAYAKFTTDADSQEKIMIAALKRAGVVDDADVSAMKLCALKK